MPKDWVQLGPTGLCTRIFRSKRAAVHYQLHHDDSVITQMEHDRAVGEVRKQVFERDGYTCVHCGKAVVWERGRTNSGELDERQARGDCRKQSDGTYLSGEVSVDNCQTLCGACHTGPGGKQDRSPSFSKKFGETTEVDGVVWTNVTGEK